MAEATISMAISGLIATAVVGVMRTTGIATKEMYAETRTRATRMVALDQIRYRLVEASIGTVVVTNANHRIEFNDPNLDTTSAFEFLPASRILYYDADINDDGAVPPIEVASGPIDLTFEADIVGVSSALVRLNVKSAADVAFGDVDEQDGETLVYLRNA